MSLIEPNVKYHIYDKLHFCHEKKLLLQNYSAIKKLYLL